jgi:hypothetical protein
MDVQENRGTFQNFNSFKFIFIHTLSDLKPTMNEEETLSQFYAAIDEEGCSNEEQFEED